MELLSRAAILAAQDLPHVDVAVPEWGGPVRVRSMTAGERDEWEGWLVANAGPDRARNLANIRARLVALTAIDGAGARLFPAPEDVELLGAKAAAAVDRLFSAASRLNRLSKADVEELAGNSERAPSDAGPSDSPNASA